MLSENYSAANNRKLRSLLFLLRSEFPFPPKSPERCTRPAARERRPGARVRFIGKDFKMATIFFPQMATLPEFKSYVECSFHEVSTCILGVNGVK